VLSVLGALLVWIPALLGWGDAVLPALLGGRLRDDDEAGMALRGFVGVGLLGTLGAALNLVVGLGPVLSTAAALAGLLLFARRKGDSRVLPEKGDLAALAGLALVLSLFASGPIRLYDTGLYHLQAVAWTTEGPLPVGLANLHRRFGLDSLWFPAAGLLELPGFAGRGPWLAPSLALFFFGSAVWQGAKRTVGGTGDAACVLLALGAGPMVFAAITKGIPSLSTDLPVTLLTILSAQFLLRSPTTLAERRASVALAALAVMVKLSGAAWFAALLVAVRVFPAVLALPAAAWVARGVALSGYVVYPAFWTRLPFLSWALPLSMAGEEIDWARSWARLPGTPPAGMSSGWGWLGPWVRANTTRLSVLYLAGLLALGIGALALSRRHQGRRSAPAGVRAVAAAAIASTLFWFLSAPDIRFGYGALFLLAALPLAVALPRWELAAWTIRVRTRLAAAAGVALLALSALLLRREGEWHPSTLAPPAPPHPVLEKRLTVQGESVWVPAGDDRCWAAPVPCTPYFREDLVVRRDSMGRISRFSLPASVPQ
jgi:hypothetical protein